MPVNNSELQTVRRILKKKPRLLTAVKKYPTPFFVFDKEELHASIREFQSTFSQFVPRTKIFYAVKSNPYPELLAETVKQGLCLDVSSALELKKVQKYKPKEILFTGPAKTDEELTYAVKNGRNMIVNIDSMREVEKLGAIAKKYKKNMKVGIRIFIAHHGTWNKFGIPLTGLAQAWKRASEQEYLEPVGIQIHTSWNENAAPYEKNIRTLGSYLRKHSFITESLSFIDLGGGFLPTYPLKTYAQKIGAAIKKYLNLPKVSFYFEPGRLICYRAMHIVMRAEDVKTQKLVVTDGATNMIGWVDSEDDEPVLINLTSPALRKIPVYIYGSLCTPEDIWAKHCYAKGIQEGDILVAAEQGAYTYTFAQEFIKEFPRVYPMPR